MKRLPILWNILPLSNLQDGINIDGEKLKDVRFADDVALCMEDTAQMERNLNIVNNESQNVELKIHGYKTKYMYMTNYKTDNDKVIERVIQYKYLGQIIQIIE